MITFLRLNRDRKGFRLSKKDNPRKIVRTEERATLHFASHMDMVFLFNGLLSYWSNAKGSAKGEEGWLNFQQSSRDRYVDLVQGDNGITTWQIFLNRDSFHGKKTRQMVTAYSDVWDACGRWSVNLFLVSCISFTYMLLLAKSL